MPSPIAHAAVGVALYHVWKNPRPAGELVGGVVPTTLLASVGLSMIPDLDAAVGIALGNLGRYHNNLAGTPLFGALVAIIVGGLAGLVRRSAIVPAFSLTYVCYQVHILMDFLTIGRGVMLLWPASDERFGPPLHLFYGLRWSDGVFSARHFITLFSEMAFVAALWLAFRIRRARRQSDRSRQN